MRYVMRYVSSTCHGIASVVPLIWIVVRPSPFVSAENTGKTAACHAAYSWDLIIEHLEENVQAASLRLADEEYRACSGPGIGVAGAWF
jgi:hypothetical protein